MGHLVQLYYPEAPSGVWSITKHGTNTPATAFSDHECVTPYTNRALSAVGRDKFWVDQLVDLTVATAAAVEVETIQGLGVSAAVVTVESASFTGTDPATAQQIAAGQILLNDAFDRMFESFGARDFNVRETGTTVDTTLADALASVRATNNLVFNVTQSPFNAVGDGATLDDTAILAAINAAVAVTGGTVYFPPGTYLVSSTLPITAGVRFLGDGYAVSVIKSLNASVGIAVSASVQFDVERIQIEVTGAAAKPITAAVDSVVNFEDARIAGPAGGNNPVDLSGSVFADNTVFSNESTVAVGFGAAGALSCQGGATAKMRIRDCTFNGTAGTGAMFSSVRDTIIGGCTFASSTVADKIIISVAGAVARSSVFGCTGTAQAGQTLILMVQDSPLVEANNMFYGNGVIGNIVRHSVASPVQRIISLSRCQAQVATVTGTSFSPTIGDPYTLFDATGNATINAPNLADGTPANPWDGAEVAFYLRNTTGGAITVTLNAVYHGTATNIAAGATRVCRFKYKASGTPSGWVQQAAIIDVT